jgi:hypothetical protein
MQHIVVHHGTIIGSPLQLLRLTVVGHEDSVPELRSHVKLLQHGIHVANGAQVTDAYEALGTAHVLGGHVVPLRNSWNAVG